MPTNICYFGHDLADPAIHRRVRMLIQGGASVTTIGFRRSAEPVTAIHGTPVIDLGRTVDGMLAKRALTVAQAFSKLGVPAEHLRGTDVVLCRNLEMLVLASRARSLYAPQAALVYECLDIHHLLLSDGVAGAALRALETRLWRNVGLLLTSSPAFIENYFRRRNFGAPIRLVENKVLGFEGEYAPVNERNRPSGPPWRIGWFGVIRCRRSLDILSSIARAADGTIEVVIRGRPSRSVFADFDAEVADRTHVRYAGPYRNPDDLAGIYGGIHFTWAIDYYESGENSAWLLPNRIYEGCRYGAVPLAVEAVETGRWLARRGVGVVCKEPIEHHLLAFVQNLRSAQYSDLATRVDALPSSDLVFTLADCRDLVDAMSRALPSKLNNSNGHRQTAQYDAN
jgi:succinoglycan biosynthesis protein ExoL